MGHRSPSRRGSSVSRSRTSEQGTRAAMQPAQTRARAGGCPACALPLRTRVRPSAAPRSSAPAQCPGARGPVRAPRRQGRAPAAAPLERHEWRRRRREPVPAARGRGEAGGLQVRVQPRGEPRGRGGGDGAGEDEQPHQAGPNGEHHGARYGTLRGASPALSLPTCISRVLLALAIAERAFLPKLPRRGSPSRSPSRSTLACGCSS